jgi:putative transposase
MCDVLQVPRSTYYYESKAQEKNEEELSQLINKIFHDNRQAYGTRKIKAELQKKGWSVSRRRIGRLMKAQGLVSKYTVAQYKSSRSTCNEARTVNILNRQFDQEEELKVVVSDLTYVRIGQRWHYICILIDLFNREIIGYSTGPNKDAVLVKRALASVRYNLKKIQLFHTDRGSEFKNELIEQALRTFEIERSLSFKGSPYDNAVAEATFKLIKTEFVRGSHFETQDELDVQLFDYVHWFNHLRIHSTLGYLTPMEFKSQHLNKSV